MSSAGRKQVIPFPNLDFEKRVGYPRIWVAGADEVGRGCIAGPVVAGAVVLPHTIDFVQDPWLHEIKDSKLLTTLSRERLAPLIENWAVASSIGSASVEEIEQINIFHASHLAIHRAINKLQSKLPFTAPDHILVDGKFLPREPFKVPATAIIKGDQKCLSIAAASIIAKVWRDHQMEVLDLEFPQYGFKKHKGYPTPAHAKALLQYGPTNVHRRTFKTVSVLLNG